MVKKLNAKFILETGVTMILVGIVLKIIEALGLDTWLINVGLLTTFLDLVFSWITKYFGRVKDARK